MEQILIAVKNRIDILLRDKALVTVAIDGSCTSGKTTLSAALASHYSCNVFHMDDFFLRPRQRTRERLAELGGNVDYERFRQEVLLPVLSGRPFSYRPFDCASLSLRAPVSVAPKQLNIIEGTYSQHPYFQDPYDLKLLLTVDKQTQRQRILQRPAFLHKRFFEEWIPMEDRYLASLDTSEAIIF